LGHPSRTRWALAATLALAGAASPASADEFQRALDRARRDRGATGAAAAVAQDGRLLCAAASGRARGSTPATADTPFVLASVTKMVTAALVVRLRDEGLLGLDDPVARWLPGLPNAERITVRMLLSHTSGLEHYDETEDGEDRLDDPRHRWTRQEALRLVRRSIFSPGQRYDYNNTNYVALGEVIEHASGQGVDAVYRRVVADPLRLEGCFFARDAAVARRLAAGHDEQGASTFPGDGSVPTDTWGDTWTDGGLACTAGGIARIVDALFRGRIVEPASVREMTAFGKGDYGLGVSHAPDEDGDWWGHDGSYGGFESQAWFDPRRRLTVVSLVNQDGGGSEEIWEAMAAAWRRGACATSR
jgi:D-alanyl-D-alanine carboxypeptidase